MKKATISLLAFVILSAFYVLRPVTMKNIEEYVYSDYAFYFIDSKGNRYYFWFGHKEGPHKTAKWLTDPNVDEIAGGHLSKFTSSGEWIYTSRLPFKGRTVGDIDWIIAESEDLIYLASTGFDGVHPNFYAFDSLGNIIWTSKSPPPGYCHFAGIFKHKDGKVLHFATGSGEFRLYSYNEKGREKKVIIKAEDVFKKSNKLYLPHGRNQLKVCKISKNRFLVVGFKSSRDRDRYFNMETRGDSIHIISFIVNDKGKILSTINVQNAEGNCGILEVDRESFGTKWYFRNIDLFEMPDSTLYIVYGTPRSIIYDDMGFLVYIAKFSKAGELLPLDTEPKAYPLDSLPLGYQKRGMYLRLSLRMEYWDYAVDSLGNFYLEIRNYDPRKRVKGEP